MKLDIFNKQKKSVFIIAEVSANHGRSLKRAIKMIEVAKDCGADAVKFQVYTPDTMTINCNNKYFSIKHPEWGGQTLYQLYKKAYTPWKWLKTLKKVSDDLGIIFFASAFDKTSVDILEDIGVPMHKVASFELIDIPLIKYMASTKKPIILSTGMATYEEIRESVDCARKYGSNKIALLKCVSSYPADPKQMNLRTIRDMKTKFKCPIGLSDHSQGTAVSAAAVALGASIIEKHFILSKNLKTPDNFFSINPKELKELVDNIRMVENALGKVHYGMTPEERSNRIWRRSIFVTEDIKKGELLNETNIKVIRPGSGLKPKYYFDILGKKAVRKLKKGSPLRLDMLEKNN